MSRLSMQFRRVQRDVSANDNDQAFFGKRVIQTKSPRRQMPRKWKPNMPRPCETQAFRAGADVCRAGSLPRSDDEGDKEVNDGKIYGTTFTDD
jgi:hypothetical protein